MLKIVFLLVDSFKLLHLLKTIKLWVKIKVKLNLNTLENFIVEKGIKKKLKFLVNLNLEILVLIVLLKLNNLVL
ncbi:hypothetical protein DXN04_34510 [Chitinophaga silvisoli]|uniref:Uncharacterized protein n=1 Tax=Chitinophaga silvisoli TaxID=2291814 RepID=A0A3E1NJ01_9BACT|nr:hypothetical protein DXN04_34510 [Chitinophaga silvisoli]